MKANAAKEESVSERRMRPRDALVYSLVAAAVFAILFPTLAWQQFGGDSEDLLVQPVLEIHRGGPWWIPALGGEPRIRKPPLPTWISAAAVRPGTVARLSSPGAPEREAAYRALAVQVRWPALLAACLMLAAVALTGQLLAGRTVGLLSAIFCGSAYLFLKSSREATTDAYLALFVSLANLFMVLAIFERRYWMGLLLAGVSLGLANMCKGPVFLLQTLAPVVAWLAYCRLREWPFPTAPLRQWLPPSIAGVMLMLLIALPWYASVLATVPDALKTFHAELTAEDGRSIGHDSRFAYLMLIPCMLPWIGFFLLGWRRLHGRRMLLAAFFVLVPLLVLTFFHDRKERYLVPVLGPAAILAAYGATVIARAPSQRTAYESGMLIFQWGTLGAIAVGVPIAGLFLKTAAGEPWHSWLVAIPAALAGGALLALGLRLQRRGPIPAAVVGALAMILPIWLAMHGLARSTENLSEMKPLADLLKPYLLAHAPNGRVAYYDAPAPIGKPVTLDLDIYLNQNVELVRDPAKFAGPDRPAAIVTLTRTDAAHASTNPDFPVPGWRTLGDLQSPKHDYHFYLLVPVTPSVPPVPSAPVGGGG